jgi:hypothetical protein
MRTRVIARMRSGNDEREKESEREKENTNKFLNEAFDNSVGT